MVCLNVGPCHNDREIKSSWMETDVVTVPINKSHFSKKLEIP